jgi:hypothetical protein
MSSPVLQGSDLVDKVQTLNLREICVLLFIKLTQSDLAALPNSHTPAPLKRGLLIIEQYGHGAISKDSSTICHFPHSTLHFPADSVCKTQKTLYDVRIEDKTN